MLVAPPKKLTGAADRREITVPQKVQLDQSEILDPVLIELRDHHALWRRLDGYVTVDGFRRDYDSAGVDRKQVRQVDYPPAEGSDGLGVPLAGAGLQHPRDLAVREPKRLGRLAQGQAGLEPVVRRYHRHPVRSPAVDDMLDYLVANPPAKIDVQVGKIFPALVKESLEGDVESQRADIGDPQQVRHQAACAAAATGDGGVAPAGVAHDVPDHQEVFAKPQPADQVQFLLEAILRADGGGVAVSVAHCIATKPAQESLG